MAYRNTPFSLLGYSFSDGNFTFNGTDLPGIRGVNITVQQDKENKFGAGVHPVARGRGVKDTTGSIDMDIETRNIIINNSPPATTMVDVAPGVFSVTFDNGQEYINISFPFIEFTNDGVETSQGDMEIVRSYDVVCGTPVIT